MTIALPRRGHITHDPAYQCSHPDCILRYRALGLCEKHYRQQARRQAAEAAWAADTLAAEIAWATDVPPRGLRRRNDRGIVRWDAA